MRGIKTKPIESDIESFLMSVVPAKKRADSIEMKKLFDSVVKEKPDDSDGYIDLLCTGIIIIEKGGMIINC